MKRTFLVKKDPAKEGQDNWIIMNSHEFLCFLATPEGQARKRNFGQLDACCADDSIIIMECGEETATKWRAERDHHHYLAEQEKNSGIENLSYSQIQSETTEGEFDGEEILLVSACNVEESVLSRIEEHHLRKCIASLPPEERKVIAALYLYSHPLTEMEYAMRIGKSRDYVHMIKRRAFRHLKALL